MIFCNYVNSFYFFFYFQLTAFNFHFTLFLHVTWMWYFESGQSDSWASCVSVSRLPMMPPPKISQVTRHWCCAGSLAYQAISAIVSDLSRTIDRTVNSNTSDASVFSNSVLWCSTTDATPERGAQLFQHCSNTKMKIYWINNSALMQFFSFISPFIFIKLKLVWFFLTKSQFRASVNL